MGHSYILLKEDFIQFGRNILDLYLVISVVKFRHPPCVSHLQLQAGYGSVMLGYGCKCWELLWLLSGPTLGYNPPSTSTSSDLTLWQKGCEFIVIGDILMSFKISRYFIIFSKLIFHITLYYIYFSLIVNYLFIIFILQWTSILILTKVINDILIEWLTPDNDNDEQKTETEWDDTSKHSDNPRTFLQ